MSRKPLTPEAKEAFHGVMRKFCEDVERREADKEAARRAEQAGRLCDEMGPNV